VHATAGHSRAATLFFMVGALGLISNGAVRADETLYYYRDGDRVVITNTPSRPDARRLRDARTTPATPAPSAMRPSSYDTLIASAAGRAGISPRLVKAVALVESNLDARAVSPKGAQGLMQLMPQTARRYGVSDPFDAWQNLQAGATHLRGLIEEFEGNLTLALAAYNAGAGAVRRHGGVPDFPETQEYVRRVYTRLGRRPGPAALGPARRQSATTVESVRMVRQTDGSLLLQN
jgi:soluble lytic murein transglycosylase-like protein